MAVAVAGLWRREAAALKAARRVANSGMPAAGLGKTAATSGPAWALALPSAGFRNLQESPIEKGLEMVGLR